jgi:hypothetical protein
VVIRCAGESGAIDLGEALCRLGVYVLRPYFNVPLSLSLALPLSSLNRLMEKRNRCVQQYDGKPMNLRPVKRLQPFLHSILLK